MKEFQGIFVYIKFCLVIQHWIRGNYLLNTTKHLDTIHYICAYILIHNHRTYIHISNNGENTYRELEYPKHEHQNTQSHSAIAGRSILDTANDLRSFSWLPLFKPSGHALTKLPISLLAVLLSLVVHNNEDAIGVYIVVFSIAFFSFFWSVFVCVHTLLVYANKSTTAHNFTRLCRLLSHRRW